MVVTTAPAGEIGPRIGDNLLADHVKSSANFDRLWRTAPRYISLQRLLQRHRMFAYWI
ncbi:MAG: hypothetical protein ABSE99_06055 [Terracidiphilus sp.]|jgi:hypothetical protein